MSLRTLGGLRVVMQERHLDVHDGPVQGGERTSVQLGAPSIVKTTVLSAPCTRM